MKDRWEKDKRMLSVDCLESISIVSDGSIGKPGPINLNFFLWLILLSRNVQQDWQKCGCLNSIKKFKAFCFHCCYYLGSTLY